MISKPDELRAAVANSRSRSVRTIRSGYIHNIDALNWDNKYHVSFQTSSSRSMQDQRRVLDLPARVLPHAQHRDHRAAGHRSFDIQPMSLHHPHNDVILVLRGARHALRHLWIPTTTLRGPSPLETWQSQLAAQSCVHYHLCVVHTFYLLRNGTISCHPQLQPAQSPSISPLSKPETINLLVSITNSMGPDFRAPHTTNRAHALI